MRLGGGCLPHEVGWAAFTQYSVGLSGVLLPGGAENHHACKCLQSDSMGRCLTSVILVGQLPSDLAFSNRSGQQPKKIEWSASSTHFKMLKGESQIGKTASVPTEKRSFFVIDFVD